jgi:hypothetical protein
MTGMPIDPNAQTSDGNIDSAAGKIPVEPNAPQIDDKETQLK